MLRAIWPGQQADIRELIVQTESTPAAHAAGSGRPGPSEIQDRYEVAEALTARELYWHGVQAGVWR